MFSASVIHPDLIQAYLESNFHVRTTKPFAIRIGAFSADLEAVHQMSQVSTSCFITPCNPESVQLSQTENNLRLSKFRTEELLHGLELIYGFGQHPSNSWEAEESYLVLGITLAVAKEIGKKYEQNAIVWIGSDAIPELILLR